MWCVSADIGAFAPHVENKLGRTGNVLKRMERAEVIDTDPRDKNNYFTLISLLHWQSSDITQSFSVLGG